MPRDGSGAYTFPAGTLASPNTVIKSSEHNAFASDLQQDANTPRPVVAGGTGVTSLTGLAKGNGSGAFSAATPGADYLAPSAIGVTVQPYDADLAAFALKTAPTGAVVGTTDTQTLSNKTLTEAPTIDFSDVVGDKITYFSNAYGVGVEASTLTQWALTQHRFRIGGTSVSNGAEAALITSTGLNNTPVGTTTRSTGAFTALALTTDLPISEGGTGASTAEAARTSLLGVSTTTDNALARYDGTSGALQNSAFVVDDSGNVSSFGGQLKFPATQNASADANTLDDYEEGSSTPTPTASSGTLTSASSDLRYVKKGKEVTVSGTATITTAGTGAGELSLALPFSSVTFAGGGGRMIIGGAAAVSVAVAGSSIVLNKFDATTVIATGNIVAFTALYFVS